VRSGFSRLQPSPQIGSRSAVLNLSEERKMTKIWLVGAAAFTMMTGVAFAQSASTSTQSTTTIAPAEGTYHSSETQKSTDSDGTATDKTQTYKSGPGGSKATSSSHTTSSDGSEQSTYKEKHVDDPAVDTTVNKSSSTTIVR
jgi:hypothetical protein